MSSRAALVALSLTLAAIVGWAFAPASYDDGYITYRYADNLAHGRGFVFNPGESVLGTSAPGYGLLLGALVLVLRPLHLGVDVAGAGIFLAGMALLPILLCAILRRLGADRPEGIAAAFALLAIPARWNVELMGCEQLPMLVLVAAAFLLALDHRELAAGLCAGLAAAFRFDAGFAVAALGVAIWIERRQIPWRFSCGALLPVSLCWGWLLVTFGSILPLTLHGKRSEMEFVSSGYNAAEIEWLLRSFGLPGSSAIAALALGGLVAVLRLRGRARLFAAATGSWLLAHELFQRLVGVPFAPWYHVAIVNTLLVLAAVGACRFLPQPGVLRQTLPASPSRRPVAVVLACTLLAVALFSGAEFLLRTWGRPPDPRIRIYRDIAAELRSTSAPDARVAAVEIGALAYFADRPVLDLAGLIDPDLRAARRNLRLSAALAAAAPEYLIDNPAFHSNFLAQVVENGDLHRRYGELRTFVRPEYPFPIRLMRRLSPAAP